MDTPENYYGQAGPGTLLGIVKKQRARLRFRCPTMQDATAAKQPVFIGPLAKAY